MRQSRARRGGGWASRSVSLLGGVIIGGLFLRHQRVTEQPLVDAALFRTPTLRVCVVAIVLSAFVMAGLVFFMAQHLQFIAGHGPFTAGLWTLPITVATIVGSMSTPILLERLSPAPLLASTIGDAGIGLAGAAGTIATDALMATAAADRAGAASAISETGSELGGALGVALLGSVGAVYRDRFSVELPSHISATPEAVADSRGAVYGIAHTLPHSLILAADAAFVDALQAAVVSACALCAVAAGPPYWLRAPRRHRHKPHPSRTFRPPPPTTREDLMNSATSPTAPRTFVLLPGAWSGPWSWEGVHARLSAQGHRVHAVTFSGLKPGDDVDAVTVQTHVDDVLDLLARLDLSDVVLVGHSYSGIVAGMVADQAPDRIAHTVYVQGFLAQHGQSLLDAFPAEQKDAELAYIDAHQGWWPPPPAEAIAAEPDLSPAQVQWLEQRLVRHPARTVTEPVALRRSVGDQPSTCITSAPAAPDIEAMADGPNWQICQVDAGHWPMLTIPDELTELLVGAASDPQ